MAVVPFGTMAKSYLFEPVERQDKQNHSTAWTFADVIWPLFVQNWV